MLVRFQQQLTSFHIHNKFNKMSKKKQVFLGKLFSVMLDLHHKIILTIYNIYTFQLIIINLFSGLGDRTFSQKSINKYFKMSRAKTFKA